MTHSSKLVKHSQQPSTGKSDDKHELSQQTCWQAIFPLSSMRKAVKAAVQLYLGLENNCKVHVQNVMSNITDVSSNTKSQLLQKFH